MRSILLTIIGSLLGAGLALAGELKLVDGRAVLGEPVKIGGGVVTWKSTGQPEQAIPLDQIVRLDIFPFPARSLSEAWTDIELTDGTTLRAAKAGFRSGQVGIDLVGGGQIELTAKSVANVLFQAQREEWRKDWTTRLAQRRRRDVLAVLRQEAVNALEGTLGETDAEGKTILFTPSGTDRTVPVPLANIHGLIFERLPDASLAPVIGRVTDVGGSVWLASEFSLEGGKWKVKTSGGLTREYASGTGPSRIDLSRGKVAYLSDLKWMRVTDPLAADPFRFRAGPTLDKNLDLGPIRMGGTTYAKGLALAATTEVEYDLGGEYRDFRLMAGFDDAVSGGGPVVLRIEGDGKELLRQTLARQGRRVSVPIVVPVKDVRRLTITVEPASADDVVYGHHVHLGDARLTR